MRLDKWLWAARFFKTRSAAQQAVDGGKVKWNGERVKPARELKVGDELAIHIGAYWEVFSPIVVIACVGAGLALLNFAVDEIANPQLRSHVGLKRWKQITAQKEAEAAAQEVTAQQGAAS